MIIDQACTKKLPCESIPKLSGKFGAVNVMKVPISSGEDVQRVVGFNAYNFSINS